MNKSSFNCTITKKELIEYLNKLPENAELLFTETSYYGVYFDFIMKEIPEEENEKVFHFLEANSNP